MARTTQIWATVQIAGYIKSRGSGERELFLLVEISTLFFLLFSLGPEMMEWCYLCSRKVFIIPGYWMASEKS